MGTRHHDMLSTKVQARKGVRFLLLENTVLKTEISDHMSTIIRSYSNIGLGAQKMHINQCSCLHGEAGNSDGGYQHTGKTGSSLKSGLFKAGAGLGWAGKKPRGAAELRN